MSLPEKEFALALADARGVRLKDLGLRFDRVVRRVATDLRAHLQRKVPDGMLVLVTLSAPIKQPASTVQALRMQADVLLQRPHRRGQHADIEIDIQGNRARLRSCSQAAGRSGELLVLVHNGDVDARQLLDAACAVARLRR